MDLKWVEDFIALATTENFSKAAQSRNVTQPAFSRRIRSLEQWLGQPLIDRSRYPTRLTPAGEIFLEAAKDLTTNLSSIKAELQQILPPERNVVRFAALHTLAVAFYPGWITGLPKPPERTSLVAHRVHDCIELITSGRCDFFLCYMHDYVENLFSHEIFISREISQERLVPVCRADKHNIFCDKIGNRDVVKCILYGDETYLGRIQDAIIKNNKMNIDPVYKSFTADALKYMALTGAGVAWLPERLVSTEVVLGSMRVIEDEALSASMKIVLHRPKHELGHDAEIVWKQVEDSKMSVM